MLRISLTLAALLAIAALGVSTGGSAPSEASVFETAVVRLYSAGKVVGEWEAVGPGKVEGQSLVFPVRQGVQELDVRIQGTWSFEAKR
ncbi:MAG: hypothetical protein QNK05_04245 [Myxococcota bacterium]|nr:hypothetical protein [Myxococcota bacterium]